MITRGTVLPLALLSALGAGVGSSFLQQASREPFDPSKDLEAICSAESPYSAEAALGQPTLRFAVSIPAENPLPGRGDTRVLAVAKDNIIQVDVSGSRPGGVAVHGILETHPVRAGSMVSVKLRAKYAGRFPLHFHGDDGSHIEVAVFEVR